MMEYNVIWGLSNSELVTCVSCDTIEDVFCSKAATLSPFCFQTVALSRLGCSKKSSREAAMGNVFLYIQFCNYI